MKLLTWNLNRAWPANRINTAAMWQRVEDLDPDVALLQEAAPLPEDLDPGRWLVTPRNDGGSHYNGIYARRGAIEPVDLGEDFAPVLEGQAAAAHYTSPDGTRIMLASVHCKTGEIESAALARLSPGARDRLPKDRDVWHQDVVLEALRPFTSASHFAVGGDFNVANRLDSIHGPESKMYWGSSVWFDRAYRAGWLRCHLKFHAGEERTFFRKDELYQLDHFFADSITYGRATACDVIDMPDRELFSDHAPLVLRLGD